jgi:hypothetical protein
LPGTPSTMTSAVVTWSSPPTPPASQTLCMLVRALDRSSAVPRVLPCTSAQPQIGVTFIAVYRARLGRPRHRPRRHPGAVGARPRNSRQASCSPASLLLLPVAILDVGLASSTPTTSRLHAHPSDRNLCLALQPLLDLTLPFSRSRNTTGRRHRRSSVRAGIALDFFLVDVMERARASVSLYVLRSSLRRPLQLVDNRP